MTINIVESFFNLLDKYLITDLDTMIIEIPARESGGVGYPAIHSIVSGMELLGFVLSEGLRDEKAFNYFWDNYFIIDNPNYEDLKLKKIFRQNIRNGTAHYFLLKSGIQLSKSNVANLHITENGLLNIDLKVLYFDFKKSYDAIKNKLLSGEDENLIKSFTRGYGELIKDLTESKQNLTGYIQNKPDIDLTDTKMELAAVSATFLNPKNFNKKLKIYQSNASTTTLDPLHNLTNTGTKLVESEEYNHNTREIIQKKY